jgi:hypothetical protein
MRAIVTLACAAFIFAAGAHAQEGLKRCHQITDDAERLKCYDALDTNRTGNQEEGGWEVRDEKSPLDDSPLVSASLPSSDGKALLLMRCKDRKTEVAVNKWGFIKCGTDVRVTYRIDQEPAVEGAWNSHSSCYLALAPSPIQFLRALKDQGKVYFRMWDHHDAPHDALFNLGDFSPIRTRLAEACDWDGASKQTGNSAPKATTPATSPGSPKAPAR